jgi:hypothetical protein
MLSIKALITTLLVGATIATPITSSAAKAAVDSHNLIRRQGRGGGEYWSVVGVRRRDAAAVDSHNLTRRQGRGGGEYWSVVGVQRRDATDDVVNVMRRDGAPVLEGHCTQEEGGVSCSYTKEEIQANARGGSLMDACAETEEGVECFFAGATPEDD